MCVIYSLFPVTESRDYMRRVVATLRQDAMLPEMSNSYMSLSFAFLKQCMYSVNLNDNINYSVGKVEKREGGLKIEIHIKGRMHLFWIRVSYILQYFRVFQFYIFFRLFRAHNLNIIVIQ